MASESEVSRRGSRLSPWLPAVLSSLPATALNRVQLQWPALKGNNGAAWFGTWISMKWSGCFGDSWGDSELLSTFANAQIRPRQERERGREINLLSTLYLSSQKSHICAFLRERSLSCKSSENPFYELGLFAKVLDPTKWKFKKYWLTLFICIK